MSDEENWVEGVTVVAPRKSNVSYNPDEQLEVSPDGGTGGGGDVGEGNNQRDECVYTSDGAPMQPPDNAEYRSPKEIRQGVPFDDVYVTDAINHLRSIESPENKIGAFFNMYYDPGHPHYLDIKTANGNPVGEPYYSNAAGGMITPRLYEPFGNFVFGLVGIVGGISASELRAGAAVAQRPVPNIRDDSQDRPHVDAGIAAGERYLQSYDMAFGFGPCG